MAQFELSTTLAAPVDTVWAALQRPATLAFVSRGWLAFRPISPATLPETWPEAGGVFEVSLKAFAVIPIGRQVIDISYPDVPAPRRALHDSGRGAFVRVWDHRIELAPQGDVATNYTDRLRIEAGWLTPLVLLWARGFYAHRQKRWHELVKCKFITG